MMPVIRPSSMVHDGNYNRPIPIREEKNAIRKETAARSTKSFFSLLEDVVSRDGGYPACPVVSNPSFRFIKPEALNLF